MQLIEIIKGITELKNSPGKFQDIWDMREII